ncbi:hypothetical protein Tco_0722874, partial [Tanacetum coccineum]
MEPSTTEDLFSGGESDIQRIKANGKCIGLFKGKQDFRAIYFSQCLVEWFVVPPANTDQHKPRPKNANQKHRERTLEEYMKLAAGSSKDEQVDGGSDFDNMSDVKCPRQISARRKLYSGNMPTECIKFPTLAKCDDVRVYAGQANSPNGPHKAQANHSSPIESFQIKQAIQVIQEDTSPRGEGTHPRLKARYFTLTFWRHPWDPFISSTSSERMTEQSGGGLDDRYEREGTPPPLTKEQIEGHISSIKSIIKDYNRQNKADPIRLDFGTDNIPLKEGRVARGKDVDEEDLSKPFKEKLKTPLTRRIIEFAGPEYVMPTNITLYDGSTDPADHLNRFSMAANSGEWPMPVWCRMFQQTLDGGARGWFESLPLNSINEWYQLREAFTTRYSIRRACYKEPHEITKVVRRANETLPAFKERWTVETGLIMGVPEVMKISSFMDSIKSPELAKRFSSNIPKTVDEMMRRVDEFVRAEEAYARTELPPGESRDIHRRLSFPTGPRDVHQRLTFPTSTRNDRDNRSSQRRDYKGNDYKNPYKVRDNFNGGRHRDYRAPYPQRDQANKAVPVLSLDSLIKCPKEILATETQLQLPAPRPVANPLRTGDPDKYCDYHQDKGHHTNDCIQLRKQLEIALESGKLNHLMKDLRQRVGRGQGKVESLESSVEVMFEHCFENLPAKIRAGLRETRTDLVGFAGEVAKPLGKIDLEVPHSERNSNSGDLGNDNRRVQTSRRKANTDGEATGNP